MKIPSIAYLFFIYLFFSLVACEEQPLPALTSAQRELIDTLYLRKISVLRPQIDSACDANFSINVQRAVDSLIKVRKEEEARLRQRLLEQSSTNPQ